MQAMQYKVSLPNDYDMDIIRHRVQENGEKTDGFQDLLVKAYLILDQDDTKEYSPLYLWKHESGMNRFIFDGFYDNILGSFGWQNINIAVPLNVDITSKVLSANYVLEIEHNIEKTNKMSTPKFSIENEKCLGKMIVYNPDKWKYVEFFFFESIPDNLKETGLNYQILHLSM